MKNGIRPKCESKEVYLSATDSNGIAIPILWLDTLTELYVCANCGFPEFYIQHKSDLKKITEKLKKVEN